MSPKSVEDYVEEYATARQDLLLRFLGSDLKGMAGGIHDATTLIQDIMNDELPDPKEIQNRDYPLLVGIEFGDTVVRA